VSAHEWIITAGIACLVAAGLIFGTPGNVRMTRWAAPGRRGISTMGGSWRLALGVAALGGALILLGAYVA
jgi:hypothetical protein